MTGKGMKEGGKNVVISSTPSRLVYHTSTRKSSESHAANRYESIVLGAGVIATRTVDFISCHWVTSAPTNRSKVTIFVFVLDSLYSREHARALTFPFLPTQEHHLWL